jgi:hypothetical protein
MTGIIMFLRLKNGDDIISECYEYDSDQGKYFVLVNPLKAVYMASNSGRAMLQVAFMPWVYHKISRTQEFSIYASEVLLLNEVSEYMEDYYWSTMEQLAETDHPETIDGDRKSELKKLLEELGLDGDLDNKKVYH